MSFSDPRQTTEREARRVAEEARDPRPCPPGFLRELFLGRFRLDLLHPFPLESELRPEVAAFEAALSDLLDQRVDPRRIDETGEIPDAVLDGLRELGAFGLRIPVEYGGLGFSATEYARTLERVGSRDGSLAALLSAHQSMGVPEPLLRFGTLEQKRTFLPRCARGAISAFALTETEVGSDPSRMGTRYELDGAGNYRIDGIKVWCTNGSLAELLVVLAAEKSTRAISAFVVETATPGVAVEHRCRFMGLRALPNAQIRFERVTVPRENLIGAEGQGARIALAALDAARLAVPATSIGSVKLCLEVCREWASERVQWGRPIGKHEAVAHKLAGMAAETFAMESISGLANALADRDGSDLRLEAAAAKLWVSERAGRILDDTLQVRGGRGYETAASLEARGERPVPVERMARDIRVHRICEGTSEVMRLLLAREAFDPHLRVAGELIDPDTRGRVRLAALARAARFYVGWYPARWLGWSQFPRYAEFGSLARHLRYVDRAARELARHSWHGMLVHGARLQQKQAFLFRLVDVAVELLAIAACCARAQAMRQAGAEDAARARQLADLFSRGSRREVRRLFRELWANDDALRYQVGVAVMEGRHAWLEAGAAGLPPWHPSEVGDGDGRPVAVG